jgi:hypothetical protein
MAFQLNTSINDGFEDEALDFEPGSEDGTGGGHIPLSTVESASSKFPSDAREDSEQGWIGWVWGQLYAQVRVVMPVTVFLLIFEYVPCSPHLLSRAPHLRSLFFDSTFTQPLVESG